MNEPLSTDRPIDLELCDPNDCDGEWHICWNCGGMGWVFEEEEDIEDGDMVCCHVCHGKEGWPCPRAKEA